MDRHIEHYDKASTRKPFVQSLQPPKAETSRDAVGKI